MPLEERQLELDCLLVTAAVGLVVTAAQARQLPQGGSLGGADRGACEGRAVLLVREHGQRRAHAGGVATRPVEPDAKRGAGRDLLAPVRVAGVWVQGSGAVESIWRGVHVREHAAMVLCHEAVRIVRTPPFAPQRFGKSPPGGSDPFGVA